MATETFAGPVDYVVFALPEGADVSAGLAAVLDRVNDGIIEVLDLEVVGRSDAGTPVRVALGDLPGLSPAQVAAFEGSASDILDDDDLAEIVAALDAGRFAVAVVYEDRSLAAAAAAFATAGGEELFSGGITIEDLESALAEGTNP